MLELVVIMVAITVSAFVIHVVLPRSLQRRGARQ
jgi:hypothetical protein